MLSYLALFLLTLSQNPDLFEGAGNWDTGKWAGMVLKEGESIDFDTSGQALKGNRSKQTARAIGLQLLISRPYSSWVVNARISV